MDGYLTIAQLAQRLNLNRSTVIRRVQSRGIPHERGPGPGGGAILIPADQLDNVAADPEPRR